MNTIKLSIAAFLITVLMACSDSNTPVTPMNDGTLTPKDDVFDANNYRTTLSLALDQLRGDYFRPFIEAPALANQLFPNPLPHANDYFGPDPFPTESTTINCDSGSVERNVTSSDTQSLIIEARFNFSDCKVQNRVYNGSAAITLDGDSPSRLGGQQSRVSMQFDGLEIESGPLLNTTSTLVGTFVTESGWAVPAYRGYTHEYKTVRYRKIVDDVDVSKNADISVKNATYTQKLETDHYESENPAYYRLSETGSLAMVGTENQKTIDYNLSIEPTLFYSSKPGVDGLPVYDDDFLSGKVFYTQSPTRSITVMPTVSDPTMVSYVVDNDLQSFSEDDEWLFPIDCNDNSAMNRRDLCNIGR